MAKDVERIRLKLSKCVSEILTAFDSFLQLVEGQISDTKKAPFRRFFKKQCCLFFAKCTKTLLEAVNTTTSVNITLLTSVERVAS